MRKHGVRLLEGDAGGFEVAGVEERLSFVPSRLLLLHLFGRRRGLRERKDGDEHKGERKPQKPRQRHVEFRAPYSKRRRASTGRKRRLTCRSLPRAPGRPSAASTPPAC